MSSYVLVVILLHGNAISNMQVEMNSLERCNEARTTIINSLASAPSRNQPIPTVFAYCFSRTILR